MIVHFALIANAFTPDDSNKMFLVTEAGLRLALYGVLVAANTSSTAQ